jgi:hypothetical protein
VDGNPVIKLADDLGVLRPSGSTRPR